jgi:transcriptional regulator with XRE-family HTH domain
MPLADFLRIHGFRHDFVAGQLGISRTHFSRMCAGHVSVSVERIYELAKIMRLPVRDVAAAMIPEINEGRKNGKGNASIRRQRRRKPHHAEAISEQRAD